MIRSIGRGIRAANSAGNRVTGRAMGRGLVGARAASRNKHMIRAMGTPGSTRRRVTMGAGIGLGTVLGANAVVGPRPRTSGANGLNGHSVGGGRGF